MSEQPRVIGGLGAASVVAGSMVGIGIFLTPFVVANQVQTVWGYMLAWLFGGLMAFAGATSYAELGSRFPQAGGDYVFIRQAFGESLAFATGLLLFIGVFVGSIATMSVAVANYQVGALFGIDWQTIGPWGPRVAGAAIIVGLTLVNLVGARLATIVQVAVTLIPVVCFSMVAIFSVATMGVPASSPAETTPFLGVVSAMTAVYFAYAGWNAVAYVGGEVDNPERNIPLGLVGGTVFVTAIYLLMNLGFLAVLGLDGIRSAFEVGTATAQKLGGEPLKNATLLLIILALLGSINATILGGARIAFALAQDKILPQVFGRQHRGTPVNALLLQCVVSLVFVATGSFEALLEMTSVAMLLIASIAVLALFRFRKDTPPPFSAMGYPLVPAFFVASSAVITVVSVWRVFQPEAPVESVVEQFLPLIGLALFAAAFIAHRVRRT